MQKKFLNQYSYVFAFLTTEQRQVVERSILPFLPSPHIFVDGCFDQVIPVVAIVFVGCHHLSENKLSNLRNWIEKTDSKCHVVMVGNRLKQFDQMGILVTAVLPEHLSDNDLYKAFFLCLEQFANGDTSEY